MESHSNTEFVRLLARRGRELAQHIRQALIAGKAERLVQDAKRQKAAEKHRIGLEALGANIRTTTGNYGRPGKRY